MPLLLLGKNLLNPLMASNVLLTMIHSSNTNCVSQYNARRYLKKICLKGSQKVDEIVWERSSKTISSTWWLPWRQIFFKYLSAYFDELNLAITPFPAVNLPTTRFYTEKIETRRFRSEKIETRRFRTEKIETRRFRTEKIETRKFRSTWRRFGSNSI